MGGPLSGPRKRSSHAGQGLAEVSQGRATFAPRLARLGQRWETFAQRLAHVSQGMARLGQRRETFAPRLARLGQRRETSALRRETFAQPWVTFGQRWATFAHRLADLPHAPAIFALLLYTVAPSRYRRRAHSAITMPAATVTGSELFTP